MSREPRSVYEFDEFRLEPWRRSLTRHDGEPLALTAKAFDALVYLVEHAGELVTRSELTAHLWPSTIVEENNLSQAISVLRRVLGDGYVTTVARRGYQFTGQVRAVPAEPPGTLAEPPDASHGSANPVDHNGAGLPRFPRGIALLLVASTLGLVLGGAVIWLAFRQDPEPFDPLQGYRFAKLTDFEGPEEQAAISRDGRFVAFLREQEGVRDAWVGLIGSGDFQNLTRGTMPELRNPAIRTLGFSPDGSNLVIWTRTFDPEAGGVVDGGWMVPTVGGAPRPFLKGIAEIDWSPDASRIVYHTPEAGDPMYLAAADEKDDGHLLHIAPAGVHCHFPLWSRNGRYIYFTRGYVPNEMDLWRVPADGGAAERLTSHDALMSYPTQLDDHTLLYLATADDGSGPWIHAFDIERGTSRRVNTSGHTYTSIAASADGQRLVATEASSIASLWHLRLDGALADSTRARRISIPTSRGWAPRVAPGSIIYRAPRAGVEGVWKLTGKHATELWSGAEGRVTAGPVVSSDGAQVAFVVQKVGHSRLYVMNADGSAVRRLAEQLDLRGAPAWSPDGQWLAVAALLGSAPRLWKIPVGAGDPVMLSEAYALEPTWSPSGKFLVFSGADVGTNFDILAVNADGSPHALPPLQLSRGSRRLDFIGDDRLVLLRGNLSRKEFWLVDLSSGVERPFTALGPGPLIGDFDVSPDGRELVFDRLHEEADVMLIERPSADGD